MTKHEMVQSALAQLCALAIGDESLQKQMDIGLELLLVLEEHPEITAQVIDKIEAREKLFQNAKGKK